MQNVYKFGFISLKPMKYQYLFILGISLLLFMSIQTTATYGINGDSGINATENADTNDQIDTENQLESASMGMVGNELLDTDNQAESASLGVVGNEGSITSKFVDIISEGKTILLNVLNIKPNTTIKHSALTCLEATNNYLEEFDCNRLIVFGKNESAPINSIESNGPVTSAKLLTVLDEGIDKPISFCGYLSTGMKIYKGNVDLQ